MVLLHFFLYFLNIEIIFKQGKVEVIIACCFKHFEAWEFLEPVFMHIVNRFLVHIFWP